MRLTDAECRALAKQPAAKINTLIETAQTVEDLDALRLVIALHERCGVLSHLYAHRRQELNAIGAVSSALAT